MNRSHSVPATLRDWILGPAVALAVLGGTTPAVAADRAAGDLIIVVGAAGEDGYGGKFREWATRWEAAGRRGGWRTHLIGFDDPAADSGAADRPRLERALAEAAVEKEAELWIVFIGHGTFDKRATKFNLRGPDVSPEDVATWLVAVERPVAMIDCSSASGPFLQKLAGRNRVVVTATKSGGEQFFARFGDHVSRAIDSPAADLDKDGQTSLLEAFLEASRLTKRFYDDDGGRIVSEHALLDDNGDGFGSPADAYRGLEPKAAADPTKPFDGLTAHLWHLVRSDADAALAPEQLRQRTELELAVHALRRRKAEMPADAYFAELERLLLKIAEISESGGK